MNNLFKTTHTLTFREADPAQIMFFGNILGLSHDAFEEFIRSTPVGWKGYFGRREVIIPIRHSTVDFKSPFFPGETYDIEVSVAAISDHSYTSRYVFKKDDKLHAEVKLVHAFVDPKTKSKVKIPDDLKTLFEKYLIHDSK
ncbi:MAG: acyl-CoA thioesterase [Bdellovibrionia bacterium]